MDQLLRHLFRYVMFLTSVPFDKRYQIILLKREKCNFIAKTEEKVLFGIEIGLYTTVYFISIVKKL